MFADISQLWNQSKQPEKSEYLEYLEEEISCTLSPGQMIYIVNEEVYSVRKINLTMRLSASGRGGTNSLLTEKYLHPTQAEGWAHRDQEQHRDQTINFRR